MMMKKLRVLLDIIILKYIKKYIIENLLFIQVDKFNQTFIFSHPVFFLFFCFFKFILIKYTAFNREGK